MYLKELGKVKCVPVTLLKHHTMKTCGGGGHSSTYF
jgi:hypothetical protein